MAGPGIATHHLARRRQDTSARTGTRRAGRLAVGIVVHPGHAQASSSHPTPYTAWFPSSIVQANVLTRSIVRDYQSLRPTAISARRMGVVSCPAAARLLSLVQPPVTGPATSTSSLRLGRCPVDITTLALQDLGASGWFVSFFDLAEAAYPRREWLAMQTINLAAILLRSHGPTSQLHSRLQP